MKALVVDGSETMRSVLRRIFSTRGFDVQEASSGAAALDLLRDNGAADIVLVDWKPEELEFVARLREHSSGNTFVIMMASTEPGLREIQGAMAAGANDYLMRPFNAMQIEEKLALAGW